MSINYKLKKNVLTTDIDECDEDNGNCEQECVNAPGSFQCRCGSGFQLREDGRTCREYHYYLFFELRRETERLKIPIAYRAR